MSGYKRTRSGGGFRSKYTRTPTYRGARPLTLVRNPGRTDRITVPPALQGFVRTTGAYRRYQGSGGTEKKYKDTDLNLVAVAQTGTNMSNTLLVIPNGTGESERIGRKINVRAIYFKGVVVLLNQASMTCANRIRIIVYLDRQCNGAAVTSTDLLQTAAIDSFYNLDNVDRFRMLHDKTFTLTSPSAVIPSAGTIQTGTAMKNWKWSAMVNLPIEYSGTTGALTEIKSNNIGVFAIADANNFIELKYFCRVRYTDS